VTDPVPERARRIARGLVELDAPVAAPPPVSWGEVAALAVVLGCLLWLAGTL
jgi:hypothetical protein